MYTLESLIVWFRFAHYRYPVYFIDLYIFCNKQCNCPPPPPRLKRGSSCHDTFWYHWSSMSKLVIIGFSCVIDLVREFHKVAMTCWEFQGVLSALSAYTRRCLLMVYKFWYAKLIAKQTKKLNFITTWNKWMMKTLILFVLMKKGNSNNYFRNNLWIEIENLSRQLYKK